MTPLPPPILPYILPRSSLSSTSMYEVPLLGCLSQRNRGGIIKFLSLPPYTFRRHFHPPSRSHFSSSPSPRHPSIHSSSLASYLTRWHSTAFFATIFKPDFLASLMTFGTIEVNPALFLRNFVRHGKYRIQKQRLSSCRPCH